MCPPLTGYAILFLTSYGKFKEKDIVLKTVNNLHISFFYLE